MRYRTGQDVRVGDVVSIDTQYAGVVVWCEETDAADLGPEDQDWSYLGAGVMINTDFGGLVHYPDEATLADDDVELVRRRGDTEQSDGADRKR